MWKCEVTHSSRNNHSSWSYWHVFTWNDRGFTFQSDNIKCHKSFVFKIWMKKHLSSNAFFLHQVIPFVCLHFGFLNFVSGEPWLNTPHLGLRSGSFDFRGHWYSFRVSVACYIEPIGFKYLFTQLFIKPTVFQTMCWDVKKHQTWSLASSTFQPGGESRWVMQFNIMC